MNPLAEREIGVSKALWRVLPALARLEDARDVGHTGNVDPRRVVAVAWSSERLERAQRLLREGRQTPPPIEVTRYRLQGVPGRIWFYIPSDGMHRARAAQIAGRRRIGARISSEMLCRPQCYLLLRTQERAPGCEGAVFLYEQVPGQSYAKRVPMGALEPAEVQVLTHLGVPQR